MSGQAATALALEKIWVSTIPLAAPTQSQIWLRPSLSQLGGGGREEKEEAKLRQKASQAPLLTRISLTSCDQGSL